jgi:hypothetical protein
VIEPSGHDASEETARLELLEFVRLVHATLRGSELSARERLEVRRDLMFLVAESRRSIFRPGVVRVICDAVLTEVSAGQPPSPRELTMNETIPAPRVVDPSPKTDDDGPPSAIQHGTTHKK